MSRNHRCGRAALAMAAAALLVEAVVAPVVRAQTPQPTPTGGVPQIRLDLERQPVWHSPGDPLDLRVRITNETPVALEGFRLQLRVYTPATSRSALHDNFDVDPLRIESSSLGLDMPERNVAPGTSVVETFDEDVEALSSLRQTTVSGVYPTTITVTDAQGLTALASITTQLLYFPNDVETPLNLVLVWPLAELPSRGANAVFGGDGGSPVPLEEAVDESGWLTGVLDALELDVAARLGIALAPTPRTIEELGDMADGYRRVEGDGQAGVAASAPSAQAADSARRRLAAVLQEPATQSVLAPYAFPDLPSIADFEHTSAQIAAGEDVLETHLDVSDGRAWVFPPAGRLDQPTLERLRGAGAAAATFFGSDALEPPVGSEETGCRTDFVGITYTCPVLVTTPAGQARGFVLDDELQQRFAALVPSPADTAGTQRLFAELVMIWAELPGVADRVVALAVPPLWHPTRGAAARFVRSLARAPWLQTRTPESALRLDVPAVPRDPVTEAAPARTQPDLGYFADIADAAEVVESFARLRPPVDLVQRLRRDVLVAQSRLWWGEADDPSRGARFAVDARREAEEQLDKISIGGRGDITLTSRRGEIPLELINRADYEVSVDIYLDSFDRDLALSENVIRQTFPPGASRLPVEVTAGSSGIFQVGIRVEASDGYVIHETAISIRSTEFNEIALGITLGALAFLVLFYVWRALRARRETADEGPVT